MTLSSKAKAVVRGMAAGGIIRKARFSGHYLIEFKHRDDYFRIPWNVVSELVEAGRLRPEIMTMKGDDRYQGS